MNDSSKYPPEVFDVILRRLSDGKSLTAVCGEEGMPSKRVVYARMKANEDFAKRYTMSIEIRAETRVDTLNEINRRLSEGTIDPGSAKIWSENLRWAAARENPKRFGDRLMQELAGPGGKDLVPEKPMDPLETARFVAYLLREGEKAAAAQKLITVETSDGI